MRRKRKNKIEIEPDLKYSSLLVAKFINYMMKAGKKSVSEKILYQVMDRLEQQFKKPALEVFSEVIDTAGPQLELKSRRIGGANYQVPYEVKGERKTALAMRWMLDASRKTKGKSMAEKLFAEMLNVLNNTGPTIKKKQDTHRMAEANKAFAHFAW